MRLSVTIGDLRYFTPQRLGLSSCLRDRFSEGLGVDVVSELYTALKRVLVLIIYISTAITNRVQN